MGGAEDGRGLCVCVYSMNTGRVFTVAKRKNLPRLQQKLLQQRLAALCEAATLISPGTAGSEFGGVHLSKKQNKKKGKTRASQQKIAVRGEQT